MNHDSRSWTGRGGYKPSWQPAAPRRRWWTKWWLAGSMLLLLACIPAQFQWGNATPDLNPAAFSLMMMLGSHWGGSPFVNLFGKDTPHRAAVGVATRLAYTIVLLSSFAGLAWVAAASQWHWPLPATTKDWLVLGLALLLVAVNLPTLIAEWTIPIESGDARAE